MKLHSEKLKLFLIFIVTLVGLNNSSLLAMAEEEEEPVYTWQNEEEEEEQVYAHPMSIEKKQIESLQDLIPELVEIILIYVVRENTLLEKAKDIVLFIPLIKAKFIDLGNMRLVSKFFYKIIQGSMFLSKAKVSEFYKDLVSKKIGFLNQSIDTLAPENSLQHLNSDIRDRLVKFIQSGEKDESLVVDLVSFSGVPDKPLSELISLLFFYSNEFSLFAKWMDRDIHILFVAVSRKLSKVVKKLLNLKVDPNVLDSLNQSPLARAVWTRSTEIVKDLIEHGASVNTPDLGGNSILCFALMSEEIGDSLQPIIELLLKSKANPNLPAQESRRPLFLALDKELDDDICAVIKMLLESKANANIKDKDGNAPLALFLDFRRWKKAPFASDEIDCAANSDTNNRTLKQMTEIVDLFLQNAADPSITDQKGCTPLILLMSSISVSNCLPLSESIEKTVDLLLAAKADPNVQDENGCTPLMYSMEHNNKHIFKELLTVREKSGLVSQNSILNANVRGKNGNIRLTRLIKSWPRTRDAGKLFDDIVQLATYTDINSQNKKGYTPLRFAIYYCNSGKSNVNKKLELVKFFLEKGANLNLKNGKGDAALHSVLEDMNVHYEVEDNDFEVMGFLLENGADVNGQNNAGLTPLMIACDDMVDLDFIELLLEYHPDLSLKDVKGETALHKAVNLDVQNLLLEHGANPNVTDYEGNDILRKNLRMLQTDGGDAYIKMLIEHKYDINKVNSNGQTILAELISLEKEADFSVIKKLVDNGADPRIPDYAGNSPLNIITEKIENLEKGSSSGKKSRPEKKKIASLANPSLNTAKLDRLRKIARCLEECINSLENSAK